MSADGLQLGTRTGLARPDRVLVQGFDLCRDLIGQIGFTQMVFLLLGGRLPTPAQERMANALLVSLAEDGLVPNTIAARLTLRGAPEALQGAVAAGILGAGSAFLGTSEAAARMLQTAPWDAGDPPDERLAAIAAEVVRLFRAEGRPIPGIGHTRHKQGDPRAERLLAVAAEEGLFGRHCRLMEMIQRSAAAASGRALPLNVTGAIAAVSSDLGFPWRMTKAWAILGRTAGILGHLAEETVEPLAGAIGELVSAHVDYRGDAERG